MVILCDQTPSVSLHTLIARLSPPDLGLAGAYNFIMVASVYSLTTLYACDLIAAY